MQKKRSIKHIYELLLRRKGQVIDAPNDTIKQLKVIRKEVENLNWLQQKFNIQLTKPEI